MLCVCSDPIPRLRMERFPNAVNCSSECSRVHSTVQYRRNNPRNTKYNKGATGAISELLASSDLLKRGYEVFRALNSQAVCDLAIISKEGTLLRIEVKSATLGVSGNLLYPKRASQKGKHDILAAVLADGRIDYMPPLPE